MFNEHEPPVFHADAADEDWIKRGSRDIPAHDIDALREWLMGQRMTADSR